MNNHYLQQSSIHSTMLSMTQLRHNEWVFYYTPAPQLSLRRIPVDFVTSETVNVPITMTKQNATRRPHHPTILIKENGYKQKFAREIDLFNHCNKTGIKVHNHTSKIGQSILAQHQPTT